MIDTITFVVCETVSEIVAQGYSDTVDDTEEHEKLCNQVDQELLPTGYYWSECVKHLPDNYVNCELTGEFCEACIVTAIKIEEPTQ